MRRHSITGGFAALAGVAVIVTGCAAGTASTGNAGAATETTGDSRPVVVAAEGRIIVLDGETLEVTGEFETEEFTRVNPAGDGQHVLVTTSEGFQVLDALAPELTDRVFEAETAGHVVHHGGETVLYDDGTGDTTIFPTDALTGSTELPDAEVVPAPDAHHGVSIVLEDGSLLTTVGDADGRSGIRVLDADREEIATSDQCPGVHGEGTAADETVVFGCEDGALLYQDGEIAKLDAPDEFGRMGNVYVSETSPVVVGDYKDDPDAEGSLLHRIALIDTEARTLDVIDLPEGAEYTFRDIARGPEDLAYILATDGSIHVLDPATGELVDAFPVVQPWEGPTEWQESHPAIKVDGDIAYVTEPATDAVHSVDLTTGEVLATVELSATPNELALARG